MGTAFAERLCESPTVDLSVMTLTIKHATGHGRWHHVAPSIAELAKECDNSDFIVGTNEEMLEAAIGSEGALSTARPGTVFLLHSSTHPDTTRR